MKLFEHITGLMHKKPKVEPEIFLSLILDESYIQAGAWSLDDDKKAHTLVSTAERAASPTWEDRIRMADHAIGKLEEDTGSTKLTKVVFGLGEHFLTKDGEIEKAVKSQLKVLSKSLGLTPLGFVPLATSIAHFLRKSEGIPTSVILIGVTRENFDISIYRVGRLSYWASVKRTEAEGEDIEDGLKSCTDSDVLPSRILLYGADDVRIQETKATLLRYQWTSKANFLHYPKIDIFPFEHLIDTVVEAGANEITHAVVEDISEGDGGEVDHDEQEIPQAEQKVTVKEEPELIQKEEKGPSHMVVVQPETLGFHEEDSGRSAETLNERREEERALDDARENPLEFDENEANKSKLVLEDKELRDGELYPKKSTSSFFTSLAHKGKKMTHGMKRVLQKTPIGIIGLIVTLAIISGVGFWMVTQYLPRVQITLAVILKNISRDETIGIDPQVTVIDTDKKIIPAKKLEKVVSGEKTVATTGKKKIGDPAKGTVTLFNKAEGTAYTLKKGTVLTTGTIQFTIDSDVSIASASTNLSQGQTVFGKATAPVTAVTVGTEGNLAANKEFTVKEYANTVLVARNDQPFTGGTSKEISVVSRADNDALQKALTADLIEKAKAELAQSVSGKEKMIDQTVKTAIKEKKFVEEIDQESTQLHGSLTVSVTAYTYNEEDVKALLSGVAQADIPSGYTVNAGRTSATISDVTVAKDGKMTAKASLTSAAIPVIDETGIKKRIAGKKLTDVEKELQNIPGVASAEFVFKSAWKKDVLPSNPDHIAITVTTTE